MSALKLTLKCHCTNCDQDFYGFTQEAPGQLWLDFMRVLTDACGACYDTGETRPEAEALPAPTEGRGRRQRE